MAATNPPVIQCKDYDYKCYRQTKTSHLYKERGRIFNRVLKLRIMASSSITGVGACVKEERREGHVTLEAHSLQIRKLKAREVILGSFRQFRQFPYCVRFSG